MWKSLIKFWPDKIKSYIVGKTNMEDIRTNCGNKIGPGGEPKARNNGYQTERVTITLIGVNCFKCIFEI